MIGRALTLGFLLLALLALPAVAEDDKVAALEAKVDAMEQKIDSLENQLRSMGAQLRRLQGQLKAQDGQDARPNQQDEQKAMALYREIQQAVGNGDVDQAKAKLQELSKEYGNTRAARRSRSLQAELELIGSAAPSDYHVKRWLHGEATLPPDTPTLLVFWEIWCPHCRREAPKMQALYDKMKDRGLQVVGMTRLSRSATEEKVMSFLEEQQISYPVALVDAPVSQAFNVRGIPAAAVVKDGKIVWRGHPARLSEEAIAGWL